MDFCDIRLSLLTILRLAIAYLSCFVCGSVIAQDKTLFGVNQINLSRVSEREWKSRIDDMAVANVRIIRVGIRDPVGSLPAAVSYAHKKSIRVLVVISRGLDEFYPGRRRHTGNAIYKGGSSSV